MPTSFTTFNLEPALMRAIAELGFEEATPVQEQVIPLLLAGKDVIAQAQTGTGKTAAFGLPILQRLDPSARYPQALVLAPTRELAVQVAEALHRMGKYKAVSSLAIYGGQPIERQLRALRQGVQIVIGTPGRIMDHIRRGTLDLDRVVTVILDEADALGESLQGRGYPAEVLHGDLNQTQRDRVMHRFRSGQVEILVATDVAARGLDIPDVTHVINYDIPWDPESYVHRIGRTGRAGREGDAITLVAPREQRQLRLIERLIGKRLQRLRLPSPADVAARRREAVMEQIRTAIDEGALEPYLSMVEALGDDYDPVAIAAAALKVLGDGTLVRAEPAEASGDGAGVEPGMERLFIHAGRRAGIRPMDIVGAIANEAGLPGNRVGAIDLYDNFAFVEVPKEDARRVLAALNNTTLRGQRVEVDVAKPKK